MMFEWASDYSTVVAGNRSVINTGIRQAVAWAGLQVKRCRRFAATDLALHLLGELLDFTP